MLLVECPRLLFPFARNILADVTRDGGFPPVLLAPIDFVALWQSRRAGSGNGGGVRRRGTSSATPDPAPADRPSQAPRRAAVSSRGRAA